ncbi:DUF4199 domain-containing protein [Chitinophaga nivalis]|uniref:DUF4199 domain-containing protein n=1 Tax=Chitinophaga nivalis TaxID=2991709 RepID=A0ABT3IHR4_9BACT|nr:DUF4199 domain-containing protein [Chitinophaga nivalis]MCW3466799.1 DUF4199 domain-containing protein [Chitinophaga nivalis]MCW3483510.1 DUF4199 domain-containing protein [Chitinophaga nivalis]
MQQTSNPGIKWGIISGLVLIFLNVISWVAGSSILFAWWNSIIQLLIFAFFGILAGIEAKKAAGGFISFKDVLKPVFITFIIGTLMITLYQYVLYKFIDPSLVDALKHHIMQATESTLRMMKAPQDEIDKQLDELNGTDFNVGLSKSFMDFLKGIIFYFVISVIIALIVRKKAPVDVKL